MANDERTVRRVKPRLWTAVGTLAAAGLVNAPAEPAKADGAGAFPATIQLAQAGEGEGEGEGEGAALGTTEADFLAALGFMEGHLRAGMALYEAGDLEDAKTHMGHPIEEKYDAVAEPLERRGFGGLRGDIEALAAAAEAEQPFAEIEPLFAQVHSMLDEVRAASPGGDAARLQALALLTRIAAQEYEIAVDGGKVSNFHEYQDAWGFLRAVEIEAQALADDEREDVAAAAREILAQVERTAPAFGDLQGGGELTMDPSLLYGAAARMELAALEVE